MSNTSKKPLISCGDAGFIINEIENVIQKCGLDEKYKENLMDGLLPHYSNNSEAFIVINETLLNNKLGSNAQENAQHRLHASAKTLWQNFESISQICQEKELAKEDLKAFSEIGVDKPRFKNIVADIALSLGLGSDKKSTQMARSSLIGMFFIDNSVAVYHDKMPRGAEDVALKTTETFKLL